MVAEAAQASGPAEQAEEASPWRDRSFLVFASGNTLNNIGEAIYAVALPMLVYDRTGSLAMMSLLAAVVPASLLLSPWLGVIVDRWGARVMVLPGLLLQVAAALALNLAGFGGHPSTWLLFGLAVAIQLGGLGYQTGWMAGVATMFPASPGRARGTLSSLFIASRIAGTLLFAALLPLIGYLGLLWINLVTFLAPMVVWWLGIRPQGPQRPLASRAGGQRQILSDLAEGWRLLRRNRLVVHATIIGLPVLFVSSTGTLALATFDLRMNWRLSASAVGVILMVRAVSGLLGSLVISQRRRLAPRPTFLVATAGWACCLLAMAVHSLAVFIVAFALSAALNSAFAVASTMLMFKSLPAEVIGRASGLINLIEGIPQLGAPLLIPLLSASAGIPGTFVVLAAIAGLALAYFARTSTIWGSNE